MTCCMNSNAQLVACGGLDNICALFNLKGEVPIRASKELIGHNGFISCCRFNTNGQILTSSGDKSCILWDIDTSAQVKVFKESAEDKSVMTFAFNPTDENIFVSGSTEGIAKIWDVRIGKSVQQFDDYISDINGIQFFPNGNAFATACEDSSVRLYDIRADRELNSYTLSSNSSLTNSSGTNPNNATSVSQVCATSLAFSLSGKYLFVGYDDQSCIVWDTFKGDKLQSVSSHSNRVSCLGVSVDGLALCTGSWDTELKVWA